MTDPAALASIIVLAGTNGAGKSSVAGAAFRARGAEYFNPDEATQRILATTPGITPEQANGAAWTYGRDQLLAAIRDRRDYTFETTLGANTIPRLLAKAGRSGLAVRIWYVGLASPELHLARVRSRVAAGGHDIPEEKIRARFDRGRENLVLLLPHLTELHLFDNSAEADPKTGAQPRPLPILSMLDGTVTHLAPLDVVPGWAKPVVAAALRTYAL